MENSHEEKCGFLSCKCDKMFFDRMNEIREEMMKTRDDDERLPQETDSLGTIYFKLARTTCSAIFRLGVLLGAIVWVLIRLDFQFSWPNLDRNCV